MKPSAEIVRLAAEIRSRLHALPNASTSPVRELRREFSKRIKSATPESVLSLALHLLGDNSETLRFFAYELLTKHKAGFGQLTEHDLLRLGDGIDSWSSVDCFGQYLSGPMWANGKVPSKAIAGWARSPDLWWRRAALVSTVPLSRRGKSDDIVNVRRVCVLLAADREDMVVKALSWALRELAKKHPDEARAFLAKHKQALAARVLREVNNKLSTGLKTPRSRAGFRGAH
jgi:3-methyladenine DNA glycosylase AlkD